MKRAWFRSVPDLTAAVAADLGEAMHLAVRDRGRVVLCLSGGNTPLPIYRALAARRDLPWTRTWLAWGDERFVAPDHEDRNERAAREALLDHVPVPEDQVIAWPWVERASPEACAEAYEARLRVALGDGREHPWFDVVLLGLGSDAHTAGLFPGSGGTRAPGWAVALHPSSTPTARLTLTPRGLSSSRRVWFLVSGAGKRDAVLATLSGSDPEDTPAVAIAGREEVRVYLDFEV